jgi:hypothetical protein
MSVGQRVLDTTAAGGRVRRRAPNEAGAERRWVDEGRLGELAVSSFVRKQLALKGDKAGKSP